MIHLDPLPAKITHAEWSEAFKRIPPEIRGSFTCLQGTAEQTSYLNDSRCFMEFDGDTRLRSLMFDNSLASIRLWSFLLSEESRLHKARRAGKKIIGVMKDLGTASLIAYAADGAVAFYPDGAWWIPCVMEMNDGLLRVADALGFGEEMCPSRAALAAFVNKGHFPMPDLLVAAVGSCCDDFSAVMQRVADEDIPIVWWDLPYRRTAQDGPCEMTPLGAMVSSRTVDFVETQLDRVRRAVERTTGEAITEDKLAAVVAKANTLRGRLSKIRNLAYGSIPVPFPSLETQICEMMALHFCSDPAESIRVLQHVLETVEDRVSRGVGVLPAASCRCVWVNPVADLRVMNLFESCGGSLAGSEYLFRHALVQIPTGVRPLRALALTALSDPMIGGAETRAGIVLEEAKRYDAEGVVISNIPGASHCATEGIVIGEAVRSRLKRPVLEITVPPLVDASLSQLSTRFEAFFESIRSRRRR